MHLLMYVYFGASFDAFSKIIKFIAITHHVSILIALKILLYVLCD